MTRLFQTSLALMTALSLTSAASAQVIDQQQTGNNNAWAYSGSWSGQTFKPTYSNSAGAGVHIEPYEWLFGSGTLTVGLYDAVGGTLLAGGSTGYFVAPGGTMVDVMWTGGPVAVTAGTQYFLGFFHTANTPCLIENTLFSCDTQTTAFGTSDSYTDGEAWYNDGSGWQNFEGLDLSTGDPLQGAHYDLTFTEIASTATPEPASFVLLGTGLFGVGAVVRRRRKNAV